MPLDEMIMLVYLCIWLGIFGAVWGSFADCAVSRWALGERMFAGRSKCGWCEHILSALDLIPVFSWLFQRGKCRYCGGDIPVDCILSELAGAAGLICVGVRFGLSLELGQWVVWWALLLCLSLADGAKRVLPGRLLLALAANRLVWFFVLKEDFEAVLEALLACLVPLALLALVLLAERLMGREVMGGGDIKLLFVLALYLSWAQLLLTLLAGCLAGLVWAALAGRKRGTAVPFGPFLAAGALVSVCFGGPVLRWYFGLF